MSAPAADTAPLRLRDAVKLAFPMGGVTARALRQEHKRGRLVIYEIGGKHFTTLRDIADMMRLRDAAKMASYARATVGSVDPSWLTANRAKKCVYVVGFADYVKIGRTTQFQRRLADLQHGAPERLKVYATFTDEGAELETRLHIRFRRLRRDGEWFRKEGELAGWIDGGCRL